MHLALQLQLKDANQCQMLCFVDLVFTLSDKEMALMDTMIFNKLITFKQTQYSAYFRTFPTE